MPKDGQCVVDLGMIQLRVVLQRVFVTLQCLMFVMILSDFELSLFRQYIEQNGVIKNITGLFLDADWLGLARLL